MESIKLVIEICQKRLKHGLKKAWKKIKYSKAVVFLKRTLVFIKKVHDKISLEIRCWVADHSWGDPWVIEENDKLLPPSYYIRYSPEEIERMEAEAYTRIQAKIDSLGDDRII